MAGLLFCWQSDFELVEIAFYLVAGLIAGRKLYIDFLDGEVILLDLPVNFFRALGNQQSCILLLVGRQGNLGHLSDQLIHG